MGGVLAPCLSSRECCDIVKNNHVEVSHKKPVESHAVNENNNVPVRKSVESPAKLRSLLLSENEAVEHRCFLGFLSCCKRRRNVSKDVRTIAGCSVEQKINTDFSEVDSSWVTTADFERMMIATDGGAG